MGDDKPMKYYWILYGSSGYIPTSTVTTSFPSKYIKEYNLKVYEDEYNGRPGIEIHLLNWKEISQEEYLQFCEK